MDSVISVTVSRNQLHLLFSRIVLSEPNRIKMAHPSSVRRRSEFPGKGNLESIVSQHLYGSWRCPERLLETKEQAKQWCSNVTVFGKIRHQMVNVVTHANIFLSSCVYGFETHRLWTIEGFPSQIQSAALLLKAHKACSVKCAPF